MPNVISVVSGKGGVGKTTFSINLAAALNEFGHNNLLIDADVSNPSLLLLLHIAHVPLTLQDVINDGAKIEHAIRVHHTGLRVVPTSHALDNKLDLSKLQAAISSVPETVIIDSPPGIDENLRAILEMSNQVIVVTNPEVPAVTSAVKVIKMAKQLRKSNIGVVVNRIRDDSFELIRDEVEVMCETPIIGMIPEDGAIRRAGFETMPVIHHEPHAPASVQFRRLAARLVGEEYIPPRFLKLRRVWERFMKK
jgi:cell division ATPase MinD